MVFLEMAFRAVQSEAESCCRANTGLPARSGAAVPDPAAAEALILVVYCSIRVALKVGEKSLEGPKKVPVFRS